MNKNTGFLIWSVICALVSANAASGGQASASTRLAQISPPPVAVSSNASLRKTYLGILGYCASDAAKRRNDYSIELETHTGFSRAHATILAFLFAVRQKHSLTTEQIRKWKLAEVNRFIVQHYPDIVNYIGRRDIEFVSDEQKKCFADFLDAGEIFRKPPNACLVRDDAFPVQIRPPMWWFAITFNKSDEKTLATQYTLSDDKEAQAVTGVPARFPTACIVGYNTDTGKQYQIAEVKCRIVSNDSKPAPTEQEIESRVKYEITKTVTGVTVENGIVPFDGTWHIECPVDMSNVLAYVDNPTPPSTTANHPPHWKQYNTFWIKGSAASLQPGVTNAFVYYKPDTSKVQNALIPLPNALNTPKSGEVGLSVKLQPPSLHAASLTLAGTPSTVEMEKLSLNPTVQTWGVYVKRNFGLTGWYYEDITTAKPDNATFLIQQPYGNFPVYYFSTGVVYIGYNPDTGDAFKGELDEIIIDPEDSHPPRAGAARMRSSQRW